MHYGAFQIFVSNPRSWKRSSISEAAAEQFSAVVKRSDTVPFAHVPYLCNPSSPSADALRKSRTMLADNMKSCSVLGIKYLVVHIGSHLGKGTESGISAAADTLSHALSKDGNTRLLLENSAGYNNSVGSKFEEIGRIIDKAGSENLMLCLDTAHAFAAGYDFRTGEGMERLCAEIADNIGFDRMGLVHLNDARYPAGSGLDRHWHIGKGEIGVAGFKELFQNRNFQNGCFIMETPINDDGNEISNMNKAKAIALSVLGRESIY